MVDSFIATAIEIRASAIMGLDDDDRAEFGQFFTPWGIAEFMAAMPELGHGELSVLDAGAGSGILSAAVVSRLCVRAIPPTAISVTLFERDSRLIPALTDTVALCEAICIDAGVRFSAEIRNEDFIESAVAEIVSIGEAAAAKYNLAILNPPYRKLRSNSEHREILRHVGIETSNLYAAFVSLALRLVAAEGELVAITPRSFCNGTYFRHFRRDLLRRFRFRRIHVFEKRDEAFSEDQVLQESIIFSGVRSTQTNGRVIVSCGSGKRMADSSQRLLRADEIVRPTDTEAFIHIAFDEMAQNVSTCLSALPATLKSLGITVSTGRVVDFRARQWLHAVPATHDAPLVYPHHFLSGYVKWPMVDVRKPQAIAVTAETEPLLLGRGTYVLVKRFSAKEEARRVVAAIFDSSRVDADRIGFENHLNYFHCGGGGLEDAFARGLTAYLNSTVFDTYFRQFSGHTQVNATDLRNMRYPNAAILSELGARIGDEFPSQAELDEIVCEVLSITSSSTSAQIGELALR